MLCKVYKQKRCDAVNRNRHKNFNLKRVCGSSVVALKYYAVILLIEVVVEFRLFACYTEYLPQSVDSSS